MTLTKFLRSQVEKLKIRSGETSVFSENSVTSLGFIYLSVILIELKIFVSEVKMSLFIKGVSIHKDIFN